VTTPSDPDQPEYSSGLPSYPSAPQSGDYGDPRQQRQPAAAPPREVAVSFWCFVAAAVVVLIGGLLYLGAKQALLDTLRSNNTSRLTDSQLQTTADVAIGFFVVVAVIIAGLYVLFAYKLRAGRSWARTALTIVVVLHLLVVLFILGGTLVSYLGAIAAIAGCGLSYLPNSRAYLAATNAMPPVAQL
jgi:hypothetical protein